MNHTRKPPRPQPQHQPFPSILPALIVSDSTDTGKAPGFRNASSLRFYMGKGRAEESSPSPHPPAPASCQNEETPRWRNPPNSAPARSLPPLFSTHNCMASTGNEHLQCPGRPRSMAQPLIEDLLMTTWIAGFHFLSSAGCPYNWLLGTFSALLNYFSLFRGYLEAGASLLRLLA